MAETATVGDVPHTVSHLAISELAAIINCDYNTSHRDVAFFRSLQDYLGYADTACKRN
jgi:hypothetical protein